MMKATLRSGNLRAPLSLADAAANSEWLSVYFQSAEESRRFFALLPKSVNARVSLLGRWDDRNMEDHYGLKWLPGLQGQRQAPQVSIRVMRVNKVTGEKNESGEKRMAKFLAVLANSCELVDDLNV